MGPERGRPERAGRVYRTTAHLILTGDLDDWTPSAPCQLLADHTRRQGQPVSIKIYPDAYHSFDSYVPIRRVPEARQGWGATIGGNGPAPARRAAAYGSRAPMGDG